ncbi:MAG: alpha-L-fucosidase [Gammaproteobacteria bacterium]
MKRIFLLVILLLLNNPIIAETYQPTHESVSKHPLPDWYQDAKFGVMIHYGLYTVPGWAPLFNPVDKILTREYFFNNPYAEWYLNTMQIKDSPTYQYHLKTYGANFRYDDFVPLFNTELKQWQPDEWSKLFTEAGAKYIVFVAKHCDGFLLWPSQFQNPYKQNYMAGRDVVGELTQSVRKYHMFMGLYYSGGYDWSWPNEFNEPITDVVSAVKKVPQSQEYADYVDHQWHELINRYHPDLLWNDVALPKKINKWKLFADYYNAIPTGVVNNRWAQGETIDYSLIGQPEDHLLDLQMKYDWFDYYSPEYLASYRQTKHKWEADHGPGYSFGYNRLEFEFPAHFKNVDELIIDLADIVSKNGNLLLAVSPMANGQIPELEKKLLLGVGAWLEKNGNAIYATKPWLYAEGFANHGKIPTRFTQSKDGKHVYVILLNNPQSEDVVIDFPFGDKITQINVLNGTHPLVVKWNVNTTNLSIFLSEKALVTRDHPLVLDISIQKQAA